MVDEEAAADFESEQPKVALFGSVFGGGGFLGAGVDVPDDAPPACTAAPTAVASCSDADCEVRLDAGVRDAEDAVVMPEPLAPQAQPDDEPPAVSSASAYGFY